MSLQVTEIQRQFLIARGKNKTKLPDPNPEWSPDRVLSFYEDSYPELTTATVTPKGFENDLLVFEFSPTVGTKG